MERIVHCLVGIQLGKTFAVQPEERLLWQAMMRELVDHLTRVDMVSSFGIYCY